jgi:hypothetical protein
MQALWHFDSPGSAGRQRCTLGLRACRFRPTTFFKTALCGMARASGWAQVELLVGNDVPAEIMVGKP